MKYSITLCPNPKYAQYAYAVSVLDRGERLPREIAQFSDYYYASEFQRAMEAHDKERETA